MKKSLKQVASKAKVTKRSLKKSIKKIARRNLNDASIKKLALKKMQVMPKKRSKKREEKIHQSEVPVSRLKLSTQDSPVKLTEQNWDSLVAFLISILKSIRFMMNTFWRVVKLLYVVFKFFTAMIWRYLKFFLPLIPKGLAFLVLECGKYIHTYLPQFWSFLIRHVPPLIARLEKDIPLYLDKVEAWLNKYVLISLGFIREKIQSSLTWIKKNYPIYKHDAIKNFKLSWILYKKYKPLSYKNIKAYFEIKEHPEVHENLKDFVTDADHFILHQEPIRGMLIIRVAIAFVFVLFIWSALTQVDELVKGDGKVVPSSQLQVLQSLDGGIVKAILVKEGDAVKAGQALVEIDTTRFLSSVKESNAQRIALGARAERINAVLENRPFLFPKNLTPEETSAYEQERRYFFNAKIQLDNQVAASSEQLVSAQRELRLTAPLLNTGAVSEVEILRLEREVTRLRGIREQAEFEFKNNLRKDLGDTMAKLNSLSEGSVGLEDRVKQSVIRSPLNGYVKRLYVNTIGGVIGAAKDIIEVVPSEDNLTIEAKVQPKDIGFLNIGQKALVKLTAYDFSIYGGMEAVVDGIGADSITDEKGNSYYIVKVKTHKLQLKNNLPIIPGMQAEVDIQTGSKSILTYLLKPILRAKQIAFTER